MPERLLVDHKHLVGVKPTVDGNIWKDLFGNEFACTKYFVKLETNAVDDFDI